ncbi:iron-sulfur cluster assembly scaffold protein [Gemmobacter serpentinus]|uniref:iron-sulfur cluster assembly scaffold protein n=1 Tax=Gemmobacter serpentinus TaxID=2652247 RepID=UPI00124C980B|nr:iron-sulfur cluster assembly scaffold protein [Gemmobacter serpentinus]
MSDDLVKLYSGRILALAANIPHQGRLPAPDGSAKCRAPLCGSTITVDVMAENGRITQFAQEVRACALGQASAAILGDEVIGRNLPELQSARAGLAAMLTTGAPPPFPAYEVLTPARDYTNRHASILLALDASIAALLDAAKP